MEERNKEKHSITKDELEFLKRLQYTMNTQDTVCQADPRFWVVVQEKKEYVGKDYGSDCDLVCSGDLVIDNCTIEDIVKFCEDEYDEELKENNITFICPSEDNKYWRVENDEYDTRFYSVEDIIEFLTEDVSILSCDYDLVWYTIDDTAIVPNTMFLTMEEAIEHIKLNHYHYSNPRPYAMTAWRSPQIDKLYSILQKVDWDNIEGV